ncbi:hypothetical protein POVWA2_041930 [Plasmodium ovale wallikeri]|uniref:Uncharacterized protein n=1 Tax=Plasmodium ovale wallikeri TaxID=864142 RepID=A0A1A8ZB11_PLAOA|nr:hypothetical protein POVWA1_043460 [Plasmodium ovale wallikeri]SBT41484.1 hypothetical protein POVWA2_041930 [Plasmodium ovale wallikeri]
MRTSELTVRVIRGLTWALGWAPPQAALNNFHHSPVLNKVRNQLHSMCSCDNVIMRGCTHGATKQSFKGKSKEGINYATLLPSLMS